MRLQRLQKVMFSGLTREWMTGSRQNKIMKPLLLIPSEANRL